MDVLLISVVNFQNALFKIRLFDSSMFCVAWRCLRGWRKPVEMNDFVVVEVHFVDDLIDVLFLIRLLIASS